jgi:hypothetical protein
MAALFPMPKTKQYAPYAFDQMRAPDLQMAQAPQQIEAKTYGTPWGRANFWGKLGYIGNIMQDTGAGLQGRAGGNAAAAVAADQQYNQLENIKAMLPPDQRQAFDIAPQEAIAAYMKTMLPAAPQYEQADFGGSRGVFEKNSGTYQPFQVKKTLTPDQQYDQSPLAQQRAIERARAGIPPVPAPPPGFVLNTR